jgi:hypothetical protein
MTALATLDGIEEGTDLALVNGSNGNISRWKMGPDATLLDHAGRPLDPFFFTGHLSDGNIYLADFSPPRGGEWFTGRGDSLAYLAVGDQVDGETPCAYFRRQTFRGLEDMTNLVDIATRGRPDWVDDTTHASLLAMGRLAQGWKTEATIARRARDQMNQLERELDVMVTYSRQARDRVARMRGRS